MNISVFIKQCRNPNNPFIMYRFIGNVFRPFTVFILKAAYFSLSFSLLLLKCMLMSRKTLNKLSPSPKSLFLSRYGTFVFTALNCPIPNVMDQRIKTRAVLKRHRTKAPLAHHPNQSTTVHNQQFSRQAAIVKGCTYSSQSSYSFLSLILSKYPNTILVQNKYPFLHLFALRYSISVT